MTVWRAKPCPWWTPSRWVHAFIGFALPVAAWSIWGYSGLGWASIAVLAGGVAWELSTPALERLRPGWGGWWPWADVADLVGFVAGWIIAALVCLR